MINPISLTSLYSSSEMSVYAAMRVACGAGGELLNFSGSSVVCGVAVTFAKDLHLSTLRSLSLSDFVLCATS